MYWQKWYTFWYLVPCSCICFLNLLSVAIISLVGGKGPSKPSNESTILEKLLREKKGEGEREREGGRGRERGGRKEGEREIQRDRETKRQTETKKEKQKKEGDFNHNKLCCTVKLYSLYILNISTAVNNLIKAVLPKVTTRLLQVSCWKLWSNDTILIECLKRSLKNSPTPLQ